MKKDKLFAEIILNHEELNLYYDISSKLDFHEPKPDLVIYLQADINILLNRIQKEVRYMNIKSHQIIWDQLLMLMQNIFILMKNLHC